MIGYENFRLLDCLVSRWNVSDSLTCLVYPFPSSENAEAAGLKPTSG